MAFALTAPCEKFVFQTTEQLQQGQLPTRCLLSLDIHNMFNRMSRRKLRVVLKAKFPHLLPLFNSLYLKHNRVYYRHADGHVDFIAQVKGYAQGCPLSAFFASMVLGELLVDLNKDLRQRCERRQHRCNSGYSETIGFFDDTNTFLLIEDVHWYLVEFVRRGKDYGCTINKEKTKILT
eukprot:7794299-Ditylum_brightwellii.AAC.1